MERVLDQVGLLWAIPHSQYLLGSERLPTVPLTR